MGWVTDNGRLKFTAEKPAENIVPDNTASLMAEFDAACLRFREVCAAIGMLIGNPNFRGGFDEMAEFENSPAAMSNEGIALSIKWMAADKLCTYLASKLGIGQPEWWYQCWEPSDVVLQNGVDTSVGDNIPLAELEL